MRCVVWKTTPYKFYLLIDEYDNSVNEVMAKDVKTYRGLFELDGPYKQLFKSVKNATEGQGLERRQIPLRELMEWMGIESTIDG